MSDVLFSERVPLGVATAAARDFLLEAMELLEVDHEISVVSVDAREMEELNQQFRNKRGPTDVLSFALNEGEGTAGQEYWLGDIVVCPDVAARQAREAGRDVEEETYWLLSHGLLHLLGYDHERGEEEARRMREKEQWLLNRLRKIQR